MNIEWSRSAAVSLENASYLEALDEDGALDSVARARSEGRRLVLLGGEKAARAAWPEIGSRRALGLFRRHGYQIARVDPLGLFKGSCPELEAYVAAAKKRWTEPVRDRSGRRITLGEWVEHLNTLYAGPVGVESEHLGEAEQEWIHRRAETDDPGLSRQAKLALYSRLVQTEEFDRFLRRTFPGQKIFSLEGSEGLVPLLHSIWRRLAQGGAGLVVMGMAHRGRLNVLAHLFRKPYVDILREFEASPPPNDGVGEGDVKYHAGYATEHAYQKQTLRAVLCPNPSHLGLVTAVAMGIARSQQDLAPGIAASRVVPLIVHGETAFTGQGIIAESLNLAEHPAYDTGGTIHVIVNNRLGFTADESQTRSSPRSTDMARVADGLILHVNADVPEALLRVAEWAADFRQQFTKDVFIELIGYRRLGHNEVDDPSITQPALYARIKAHPTVTERYGEELVRAGVTEEREIEHRRHQAKAALEGALAAARDEGERDSDPAPRLFPLTWPAPLHADSSPVEVLTPEEAVAITTRWAEIPLGFRPHRVVSRLIESRLAMARGERDCDWGCAEMWAIALLLKAKFAVRLVGQDSERGTFAHRHAVWHDQSTGARHEPYGSLETDGGKLTIANSPLSELAPVGFEYGYGVGHPRGVALWEAQYGDFVNMAQPMLDEYLATGQAKWGLNSRVALLLPHEYEGQGPDHSSARPERVLQMCSRGNLEVHSPTLPAQYFHLLRRIAQRDDPTPTVVFTPKSALRNPRATSPLADFGSEAFRPLWEAWRRGEPGAVKHVILSWGKILFRLLDRLEKRPVGGLVVAQLDQLYPFPTGSLVDFLRRFPSAQSIRWLQDEPRNMGAFAFVEPRLGDAIDRCGGRPRPRLDAITRAPSVTPVTASRAVYEREEERLLDQALSGLAPEDAEVTP